MVGEDPVSQPAPEEESQPVLGEEVDPPVYPDGAGLLVSEVPVLGAAL